MHSRGISSLFSLMSMEALAKQSEAAYLQRSEDVGDSRSIKMINYKGFYSLLIHLFMHSFFTTPLAGETNHQVPPGHSH